MSGLRQDPTTWLWVIAGEPAARSPHLPAGCPFCTSGYEGEVQLAEKRDANGAWAVRVLADRAPVFHAEGELARLGSGLYDRMNAVGAHELVVEGPAHDATVGTIGRALWRQVLEAFRDRLTDLKGDERLRYIEIFQNQGPEAGALISHPHAQIVGSPVIPARVERELRATHTHYEMKERCLYCDVVRQEIEEEARVVELTDDFLVFCPYASRFPYELWLLPRRHHSCFEEAMTAAPEELDSLAAVFSSALRRAEAVSPALNFVLHSEPNRRIPTWLREEWQSLSEDFHWHIEITPRLRRAVKTLPLQEYYLNQVLPEDAARELRAL